ncbi:hypothetical protein AAY473_011470 [Plecturocebus cupreus]
MVALALASGPSVAQSRVEALACTVEVLQGPAVGHEALFGHLSPTLPDGDPGGRLASGPLAPGPCPSPRCSVPGELKLRPFLVPWSPALSCGEHIWVPLHAHVEGGGRCLALGR